MKLLSASQIKEVDKCSILKQGITSLDLMERAASMFVQESLKHIHPNNKIHIYCGKGNNGGDGLVAARKLNQLGFEVIVFIVQHSPNASEDFQKNFDRLKTTNVQLVDVFSENDFIDIDDKSNIVCIDAILGSGVNKPSSGIIKQVIDFINQNYSTIISIDVPSGLFLDSLNHPNDSIIKAHYTFTFQLPKLSFFFPENQQFVGNWTVVDIGLSQECIDAQDTFYYTIDDSLIKSIYIPRENYKAKWDYGHCLIIAGSMNMPGAAMLCSAAALRSGCGLVSIHSVESVVNKVVSKFPECIISIDNGTEYISKIPSDLRRYSAIAFGCGIGSSFDFPDCLLNLFQSVDQQKLVIDADGLNALAKKPQYLNFLPKNKVILTPHIREFDRVFRLHENHYERLKTAIQQATSLQCVIVLKSHYTAVITPSGKVYFNTIANSGLAKGGSGDVLTGLIAGLCARGYSIENAAILGVYIHSLAAQLAIRDIHPECLLPEDVLNYFSKAFFEIQDI